jgi:Flp pilus assembly protein TadG
MRKIRTRPPARDERGAVALLSAALAVVLFLVAALVVDLGFARDLRRQSQNAADASALAGANVLYLTTPTCSTGPCSPAALSEIKAYAQRNLGVTAADWAACRDSGALTYRPEQGTTGNTCISFDQQARPTKVRVRVPDQEMRTAFGMFAGTSRISVSAMAAAALTPGQRVECTICVIGAGTHDIGNGNLTVNGGGIHVNGNLSGGPNSEVRASGPITVQGTASAGVFSPLPTVGPQIGDPLASLTLPPAAAASLTAKTGNPCTSGPGRYDGYSWSNNANCSLPAGLYVVTGAWNLGNNTVLGGTGVTLYFTCGTRTAVVACSSAGQAGGMFDGSNGNPQVTANASSPIPGMAIVYDRNNTSDLRMQGNGSGNVTGTIYAARSRLYANGNSCMTVNSGSIVVGDVYNNGNRSCITVNNGSTQVYVQDPDSLHLDE